MSERVGILNKARIERTFQDWQSVNRYTRSLENLWGQIEYVLESADYMTLESERITSELLKISDALDTEIGVWKQYSEDTRKGLREQCESSTKG